MPKHYLPVKFRLYPDKQQKHVFRQTIGSTRFIYNYYLAFKNEQYQTYLKWQEQNPDKKKKDFTWSKPKTESELKKEFEWLKVPDSQALIQSKNDLETAFDRFFKGHAKHPRFHKKNQKESFRCTQHCHFDFESKQIKIGKNGWIKARGSWARAIGKLKNVTVSLDAGHWYASCLLEVTEDQYYIKHHHKHHACGIDLGVVKPLTITNGKSFAVTGLKVKKQLECLELRRKRYQRQMQRKVKGSCNRLKARHRVQRAYQKERFVRSNFVEQTSCKLSNLFGTVVFEDLKIKNMTAGGKNKNGLNREMLRLGLGSLVTRTQQKADRKGGLVVFVNPAYTSQTCSDCGSVNKESRKSQSRYQCIECGFKFNADKNAALNILAKANV